MGIKLKGHETFALREGWINKGLAEVHKNPKVFLENHGADALGVGSNMAKAIRYWLKAAEFIEEIPKQGAKLTDIGSFVFNNDTYLEGTFALWIFHINLAWNKDMATSWYAFFNEVKLNEFTKEELIYQLLNIMTVLAEGQNVSERSLRDDVNVLLSMYVKEHGKDYDPEEKKFSPFAKLELVKRDGDKYFKNQPDADKLQDYVVLYGLQKYFRYKNSDSAGIEELLNNPLSPGRILNLKRVAFNEYIDSLAAKNYLTVNRTAGLDMVYIKTAKEPEEIVKNYYKMNH